MGSQQGHSIKEIADHYGCSKNKVRSLPIDAGLTLRERHAQTTLQRSITPGKQARFGTKKARLKRLEEWAKDTSNVLTESQVKALEDAKAEKEAHGEIETHHPGFLLGQDSYYVGYIKGVGKIHQ